MKGLHERTVSDAISIIVELARQLPKAKIEAIPNGPGTYTVTVNGIACVTIHPSKDGTDVQAERNMPELVRSLFLP